MCEVVLVVEDNEETGAMLSAVMEEAGFQVERAGTAAGAREFLRGNTPALIILDLVLPDGNGLEICSRVREDARLAVTPVIAITGQDALSQKEKGFACGVDQYLTKPIDTEEVVLWAKALLRRVEMDRSGGAVVTMGDLQLDRKAQLARYKDVTVSNLTSREFALLYALVRNSPGVLSRRDILAKVWRTISVDNLVDTHLFNLRNKLPPAVAANIQSIPGKGFRYLENRP